MTTEARHGGTSDRPEPPRSPSSGPASPASPRRSSSRRPASTPSPSSRNPHGPGGTWWDNRYPGAEVDVASHLYSYSFKTHDWTRTHAKQAELQAYLEEVLDDYGLRPHFRFDTTVRDAVWDERTHTYAVNLEGGETVTAHIVVSALGLLNYPKYPDWPGPRGLRRPQVPHLPLGARARPDGKAGGAWWEPVRRPPRSCPRSPRWSTTLYLFQREPGWVVPKGDRDFTPEERATYQSTLQRRITRWKARLPAREEPARWGHPPARHQDQRATRAAVPDLHRAGVRRPAGSGRGPHAEVPVPGQAPDHQLDLLPGAPAGQRRAGPPRRPVGHRERRGRRRRQRVPRRRPGDGHRLPAGQLPVQPRGRRPRWADHP